MTATNNIIAEASAYVEELFTTQLPANCTYHNQVHTNDIVAASLAIGKGSHMDEAAMEVLQLAALFHDTGHTQGYEDHEEKGVAIATAFLEGKYPADKIEAVCNCIRATKMPQSPKNEVEQVLCDADLNHLGSVNYHEKAQLLRQEWETVTGNPFSEYEWLKMTIDFFEEHTFFTTYAREQYNEQKALTLQKIKDQFNAMEEQANVPATPASNASKKDTSAGPTVEELQKTIEKLQKKAAKQKEKENRTDRGIETMFRTTSRNHIQLSAIADNKANIMLSINAIIISIVLSALLPRFGTGSVLIIPTIILLCVCVLTIVFATMSTVPKVTQGTFTKEDIQKKRANLLFFGNFHSMDLDEFQWGMNKVMEDRDFLYGSMIRDLYFLGKVLNRKYRYLRISYWVFMMGMIASVLAFIAAFIIK